MYHFRDITVTTSIGYIDGLKMLMKGKGKLEIIKNKKRIVSIVGVLMLVLMFFFLYNTRSAEATGKIIIINPGHMVGVDSGAVNSSTGIQEVNLNNALAIKVVSQLRDKGFNAMLSHQVPGNPGLPTLLSSNPPYSAYSTTICNSANQQKADLLISIHHNSGGSTASGYEFYWSSYHPSVDINGIYQATGLWSDGSLADLDSTPSAIAKSSKVLANSLNENFKSLAFIPSRNNIVERDDAITRKTSMPSVLIEAGFVSNNSESLKLANESNQSNMANKICDTIADYFEQNSIKYEMSAKSLSTSSGSTADDHFTVTAAGLTSTNGINGVSFAVTSETNGNTQWYAGEKQSDGSYSATINTERNCNAFGKYMVSYYGKDKNDTHYLLGTKEVAVTNDMKATSVTASGSTISDDIFKVTTSGLSCTRGINGVSYEVISESNGVIQWYAGIKNTNGSYTGTILTSRHKLATGKYSIIAYGKDKNDAHTIVGKTQVSVLDGQMTGIVSTSVSSTAEEKFTATVNGIKSSKGIGGASFAVVSQANGIVQWYAGVKNGDGSYSAVIDTKRHDYVIGKYSVYFYGKDQNSVHYLLGTKEVKLINDMKATSVTASGSTVSDDTFKVTTSGLSCTRGINGVSYEVISESNGSIQWYAGIKNTNGSYTGTILTSRHNYATGIYTIIAYGKDKNDAHTIVGKTQVSVLDGQMTGIVSTSVSSTAEEKFTATVNGIKSSKGIGGVSFAVTSELNGIVQWYAGVKNGDGSYRAVIDTKRHDYATGKYRVDFYGKDQNNVHYLLGTKEITITNDMKAINVTASGSTISDDTFKVTTSGLSCTRGINGVSYEVISETNGVIQWYAGVKNADGSYTGTILTSQHKNATGKYTIIAYGKDRNDYHTVVGRAEVTVVSNLTAIMTNTQCTTEQLAQYYKDNGKTFPGYYENRGVKLERFAQIYIEEANAEGVRAEIAFAQAMLETGFLQFGGDVKIEQFNFAGLGATGGVPGNSFVKYGDNETGIRMGIRAHIQHLKCYASTEPLNFEKVDERFYDSLRNKAPYVEWLGIPDNPYGSGWASAENYGSRIINMVNQILGL